METPKERAKSVNNKGTTRCSGVFVEFYAYFFFVVNFTNISHDVQLFLFLNWNKYMPGRI